MSKIILSLAILLAWIISASAQNTVSFDNQSGEPALVKLIGPTLSEIVVPDGTKQAVQASAGKYFIKIRFGVQGKYHYTKGQEFTVDETATTTSEITITLHKVVNGNYDSSPINEQEFGASNTANGLTNGNATTATTTSLDSTNASERVQAVAHLTDQSKLAKVALEDEDEAVRRTAISNLTDQALLAKIVAEENGNRIRHAVNYDYFKAPQGEAFVAREAALDVRCAAIERLTNQALLARIALDDSDEGVRNRAIQMITDQALLAKIVAEENGDRISNNGYEYLSVSSQIERAKMVADGLRISAIEKLTNQAVLAKIAAEVKDVDAQCAAFDNLTDQSLLAKLVTDKRVPLELRHLVFANNLDLDEYPKKSLLGVSGYIFRRLAFANKLTETNVDFEKMAGDMTVSTSDGLEAMGRVHRALADPTITNRIPNITFDWSFKHIEQLYSGGLGNSQSAEQTGELVTFTLKQGSEVLTTQTWATDFPKEIFGPGFRPALVNILGMMQSFFSLPSFHQEDLIKLSQSEVPEIRDAAKRRLDVLRADKP